MDTAISIKDRIIDEKLSGLKTMTTGIKANKCIDEGMTANSNSISYHLLAK